MNRGRVAVTLSSLILVIAAIRLVTYHEPLERDITTYAVIGHEMLAGRTLYRDLWDHKPPAVHVSFALAEKLVGYGPAEVYALGVLSTGLTMLAVFAAARALRGDGAGIVAAAFYTIVSGDLALQANQPNVEAFLNPLLTAAMALLLSSSEAGLGRRRAVLLGVLFAAASLYKPHAVVAAAIGSFAFVAGGRDLGARRAALRDVAVVVAIGALTWIALALWLVSEGSLAAFRDAVFTYNAAYAGSPLRNVLRGLQPKWLQSLASDELLPLVLLAGFGLSRVRRRLTRTTIVVMAWIAATHVMVAAPGKFWPHYFQLWLPLLATLAGAALTAATSRPRVVAAATLAFAAILIAAQLPAYRLSPEAWSERKYGSVFVDSRAAAHAIDALLAPGETFYQWGAETGLYFYTRRSPPSGAFFHLPLLDGPLAQSLTDRVLHDLERTRPELVVVYRDPARDSSGHAIPDWVRERYAPLGELAPGFGFHALIGGRVARTIEEP